MCCHFQLLIRNLSRYSLTNASFSVTHTNVPLIVFNCVFLQHLLFIYKTIHDSLPYKTYPSLSRRLDWSGHFMVDQTTFTSLSAGGQAA